MSKNVLVVEGDDDRFFVQKMVSSLTNVDVEISHPVCNINEYHCLGGLSEKALSNKLYVLKNAINKQGIEKIGIIVDADEDGVDQKIILINSALNNAGFYVALPLVSSEVFDSRNAVYVSCYVLHVDGHGELETLLRAIKYKESPFADCLFNWDECLKAQDATFTRKEFDKFWRHIYQKYDCCSKDEREHAKKYCGDQSSMEKEPPIWNFDHEALAELKAYLSMFT